MTVDTVEPRISRAVPSAGTTGVWPGANVAATSSEPMKGATVTGTAFKLVRRGTSSAVGASVSYDAATKKATLNPTNNLVRGATYVVTVSTSAKDPAGNALDQNPAAADNRGARWSFTVES